VASASALRSVNQAPAAHPHLACERCSTPGRGGSMSGKPDTVAPLSPIVKRRIEIRAECPRGSTSRSPKFPAIRNTHDPAPARMPGTPIKSPFHTTFDPETG